MKYTPNDLVKLFSVSKENIRLWAIEFKDALSPTASPGTGKHRAYSDSDLEVFALISRMKGEGRTFQEIHLALANGQRATPPAVELAIMPPEVQMRLMTMKAEIDRLQQIANEYELLKPTLEPLRNAAAQAQLLEKLLSEAQAEIKALNREIGRLEASKGAE